MRVDGATVSEACLNISEFVFNKTSKKDNTPRELCVATLSLAQWPELLACGGYAAKRNTALLLEDQASLDGIASCLEFVRIHRHEVKQLTSIGSQLGLTKLDLDLLCNELTGEQTVQH